MEIIRLLTTPNVFICGNIESMIYNSDIRNTSLFADSKMTEKVLQWL